MTPSEREPPAAGGFLRLSPVRVDLGDVLVQILAVALGVILGFAATSLNERAHQRTLLRETVGNIAAELRSNQSGMRDVMAEHAKAAAAFSQLEARSAAAGYVPLAQAKTALGVAGRFRENIPLGIAWQIAQNDQGLTLLPYQERYDLAWIYQLQAAYYQTEERYRNSLLSLAAAPDGNYFFATVNFANQLQSVVATERQLDALYTAAIAKAEKAFP